MPASCWASLTPAPSPWLKTPASWSRTHLDFPGPVSRFSYLVLVDPHSNWSEVIPLNFTTTTMSSAYIFNSWTTEDIVTTNIAPYSLQPSFNTFVGVMMSPTSTLHHIILNQIVRQPKLLWGVNPGRSTMVYAQRIQPSLGHFHEPRRLLQPDNSLRAWSSAEWHMGRRYHQSSTRYHDVWSEYWRPNMSALSKPFLSPVHSKIAETWNGPFVYHLGCFWSFTTWE